MTKEDCLIIHMFWFLASFNVTTILFPVTLMSTESISEVSQNFSVIFIAIIKALYSAHSKFGL